MKYFSELPDTDFAGVSESLTINDLRAVVRAFGGIFTVEGLFELAGRTS